MLKPRHPIRVYADTSVYGGVFDEIFATPSREFFAQVRAGRFELVYSVLVARELAQAPEMVRELFQELRPRALIVDIVDAAVDLQAAYLKAGVVGPRWMADALHVAVATVAECRVIVSWNFKHLVRFDKIGLYNGINTSLGFGTIGIHTPSEVIEDD